MFGLVVTIYLLNSIGLPVYYHYCGGELESVNALFESNSCCSGEEEDKQGDCCSNETQIVAQFSESSFKDISYKIEPPVSYFPANGHFSFSETYKLQNTSAPVLFEKDDPVPISGRNILASKSVLII